MRMIPSLEKIIKRSQEIGSKMNWGMIAPVEDTEFNERELNLLPLHYEEYAHGEGWALIILKSGMYMKCRIINGELEKR